MLHRRGLATVSYTHLDVYKRQEKGYEVVERKIEPEELGNFSECFTTGSAAEVTPVKEIAGIHYQPGRISEDLVVAYENLVRGK